MNRKLIVIVACILIVLVCGTSVSGAGQLCDLNNDGVADVLDCFIAEREIREKGTTFFDDVDINTDGELSYLDFELFLRSVLGELPEIKITENKELILSNFPEDTYELKYEDDQGVLEDYDIITTVTVNDDVSYCDIFNKVNCAPVNAVSIGVYNSQNERVGSYSLGGLSNAETGEKKYSFGAVSDTHIGSKTSETDLRNALTYFENDEDIEFTTVCGDLSLGGANTNLELYKKVVDESTTKPVYAISGNHETNASFAPLAMDSLKPYTEQDLYYSFEKENDVYIMLGMYDVHKGYEFAEGELQWLYEVLEQNRNKRCFLFLHLYPRDGSGDAIDMDLEGDMLNNTQGKVFYSLISHYRNVIYFHGHSHESFKIQSENKMNNYDDVFGCHSVHIPSLAYPKKIVNGKLVADYDASEGYVIDVYENGVVLKGRDFSSGKFLPIASYYLDTTVKPVESNTYYDSTGTIINENSNVLKIGSSWYKGSADKKTITKIIIENSSAPIKYDECWDASISGANRVVVYRVGNELFIVGDKNGVVANSNSADMFLGFTNLTEIQGMRNLKVDNITNMSAMFKNCNKLQSIDLSGFENVKPADMMNVFSGCNNLASIDLSMLDLVDVNKYTNLFYNCKSLRNIIWPEDVSKNQSNIYCLNMYYNCSLLERIDMTALSGKNINLGSTFSGCTSLKDIKFGTNKMLSFNSTFCNCSSLVSIDISGFDVSNIDNMSKLFEGCVSLEELKLPDNFNTAKVKSMRAMFKNCTLLTFDCSAWDTTALTDIVSFNEGAPGVIAPVICGD